MAFHYELVLLAKVLAVALAVGLDVLAVSIGVGVARLAFRATVRLGFAFAGSEIAMQVVGYELGAGAGRLLGEIATYIGLGLLALVGAFMIKNSSQTETDTEFDATRGAGLAMTSLSISLDSLGVGVALPAAAIPLLPLLITVSITTTFFTFVGLAFGARLGEHYERRAERAAGTMLLALAATFLVEKFL